MFGDFRKLSLSLLDHLIQHVDIWTYSPLFYFLMDFLWRRIGCRVAFLKRHLRVNSSGFLRFWWHAFFQSSCFTPQWSRQNVGVKFSATTCVKICLDEDFDPGSNWRVKPTTHFITIAIKANGVLWANSAVIKEWTVDEFLKISYIDGIYGDETKSD